MDKKRLISIFDAEEDEFEGKKHYRAIMDAMTDYIYVVHLQDGQPVRTEHSPSCKAVTGYSPKAYLTNPNLWYEMVYHEDREKVLRQAQEIVSKRCSSTIEHRLIHKNGSIRWVRNTVVPHLEADDMLTAYYGLVTDITKEKEAYERLSRHKEELETLVEERTRELKLAKEEAEAANRAKTALIAKVSHDIRTPLTGIIGMIEIIRDLCNIDHRLIETLNAEADLLLTLINDVLDLTKLEQTKITLEKIPFNLDTLIDTVYTSFNLKCVEKGIDFNLRRSYKRPAFFIGDPTRLRQILMNLLSNAVKFTQEGAINLSIETSEDREDLAVLKIMVCDTGIGIPQDKIHTIFEPYTQAHNSEGKSFGGSGLGLTICKQLTELMGGEINVESTEGYGTTFTVHIPLKRVFLDSNEGHLCNIYFSDAGSISPPKCPSKRVLIAEDNALNQMILERQVRSAGYIVELVSNGLEAVNKFRCSCFDAILMDIQMPILNGIEAAKEIREIIARNHSQSIPIIALTAHIEKEMKDYCIEQGFDDYLVKPVKKGLLLETLHKWVGIPNNCCRVE